MISDVDSYLDDFESETSLFVAGAGNPLRNCSFRNSETDGIDSSEERDSEEFRDC